MYWCNRRPLWHYLKKWRSLRDTMFSSTPTNHRSKLTNKLLSEHYNVNKVENKTDFSFNFWESRKHAFEVPGCTFFSYFLLFKQDFNIISWKLVLKHFKSRFFYTLLYFYKLIWIFYTLFGYVLSHLDILHTHLNFIHLFWYFIPHLNIMHTHLISIYFKSHIVYNSINLKLTKFSFLTFS